MTIRRFGRRPLLQALALLAIALLALVPTVSRVARASVGEHCHSPPHAHVAGGMHGAHVATDAQGCGDDDCGSACGYCTLLSHAPAAAIAFVPVAATLAFDAVFPPPLPRRPASDARGRTFLARGPPRLPA